MITCTKKYINYPIAHRIHNHDGHCAKIHGHNLDFEISFSCQDGHLQKTGFVIDFGKLELVKNFLDSHFDHTCVLRKDDPLLQRFREWDKEDLIDLIEVEDCSSEGLAKFIAEWVNQLVGATTEGRVGVSFVTVFEDSKNSATYIPELTLAQ